MVETRRPIPGKVVFVVVVALILAAMGLLMGPLTLASSAYNKQIMLLSTQNRDEQAKVATQKFLDQTATLQKAAFPAAILKMIYSGLLLWSSIFVLKRKERGRVDLRRWLLLGIPLEFFSVATLAYVQFHMLEPTREYYSVILPQMKDATGMMLIGGIVFAAIWSLVKIVYYLVGRGLLNDPAARLCFVDDRAADFLPAQRMS